MFEDITKEQRDAWRSKVRAVDLALKSAVEPKEMPAKPVRHLHLLPSVHMPHMTHGHKPGAETVAA